MTKLNICIIILVVSFFFFNFFYFIFLFFNRQARKWYQALPEDKQQDFKSRAKQLWYMWLGLAGGAGVAFWMYYNAHVEATPWTGRKRFISVTHDQFVKICEAEAEAVSLCLAILDFSYIWEFQPRSVLATHIFDLVGIKRSLPSTKEVP